ncbi:hypothetical protein EMIT0P176_40016 [Pseudomonas sp. IT-P176]
MHCCYLLIVIDFLSGACRLFLAQGLIIARHARSNSHL